MKSLFVFLILVLFIPAFGQLPMQSSPIREKLITTAEKYVGIREATGHNDGKDVVRILRNVNLHQGDPWCAATMAIIHDENNIPNPRSGYCPDWFKSNVVYEKTKTSIDRFQAKPGQVFGLYIEYKRRVGHVGMIVGESKFSYHTIEGNTNDAGSDEGEGCYKKIRNKRSIYVISDYAMTKDEKRKYLGK